MIAHLLLIFVLGMLALSECVGIISMHGMTANKRCYWFCVIYIIVFGVMMSDNFGVDYLEYQGEFLRAHDMSAKYILTEWPLVTTRAYYLIVHLLSLVIENYWVFKGVVFSAEVIVAALVINSIGEKRILILFCYWCLCSPMLFNGVTKQIMAITIALVAFWLLIKKRKYMRGMLLLLLASFVHGTALVCFLYLPFCMIKKRINSWEMAVLLIFAFNFIDIVIYNVATVYRGGSLMIYYDYARDGMKLMVLRMAVIIVLMAYLYANKCKDNRLLSFSFNMYFIAGCVQIGALSLNVFNRVSYYFICYFGFLIDEILKQTKIEANRKIVSLLTISGVALMYMMWARNNPYVLKTF